MQTVNISTQCCHLACVGFAYRVHYNYDLPSSEMEEEHIQEAAFICCLNVTTESAA
jgi:hypothetical protein